MQLAEELARQEYQRLQPPPPPPALTPRSELRRQELHEEPPLPPPRTQAGQQQPAEPQLAEHLPKPIVEQQRPPAPTLPLPVKAPPPGWAGRPTEQPQPQQQPTPMQEQPQLPVQEPPQLAPQGAPAALAPQGAPAAADVQQAPPQPVVGAPLPAQGVAQPRAQPLADPTGIHGDPWGDLERTPMEPPTWMWNARWRAWMLAPSNWWQSPDSVWAWNDTFNVWVWFTVPEEFRRLQWGPWRPHY